MASVTEKFLDKALESAFKTCQPFCDWFLSKTKFSGLPHKLVFSRSDHPWCQMEYVGTDPNTGASFTKTVQSETDILVVFEDDAGRRVALHIENKLADGKFTDLQPEMYSVRARKWLENAKYGSYLDFETVLVSPRIFRARSMTGALKFDRYVAHEEIAAWIPDFKVVGQEGSIVDRWADTDSHADMRLDEDA